MLPRFSQWVTLLPKPWFKWESQPNGTANARSTWSGRFAFSGFTRPFRDSCSPKKRAANRAKAARHAASSLFEFRHPAELLNASNRSISSAAKSCSTCQGVPTVGCSMRIRRLSIHLERKNDRPKFGAVASYSINFTRRNTARTHAGAGASVAHQRRRV